MAELSDQDQFKLERLKLKYDFTKFALGTVFLGLLTLAVDHVFKTRELDRLEMEQFGKYVEQIQSENVARRERLARFFIAVTRSEAFRQGWVRYLAVVEQDKAVLEQSIAADRAKEEELKKLASSDKAKAQELKVLRARLDSALEQLVLKGPVNATAPGGTGTVHGKGSGGVALSGFASDISSGSATLSVMAPGAMLFSSAWIDAGSAIGNLCPEGFEQGKETALDRREVGFPPQPQVRYTVECNKRR